VYDAARAAVRPVDGGLQVDLYVESAGVLDGVEYDLRTDYPRTVDSASVEALSSGGHVTVSGTTVTVEFDRALWISSGQVRFLTPTANCTDETGPLHGRRGAFFHGPLLLGADAVRNDLENVLRSRRAEIRVSARRVRARTR
jgi:hypothetical protein